MIYPLFTSNFSIPENSETLIGCPAKSFGTVKRKKFYEIVILLLSKKIDFRTFLKHRRFPLRMISVLWDKKISIENRELPIICLKVLDNRNLWNTDWFPAKIFGIVKQKKFDKIVIRLISRKNSYRTFLKHRSVPLSIFLVMWVKKNFNRKSW